MIYFAVYDVHPHFVCIIHRIIILYPWYVIIIPMYNAHAYFSLKNLGKKYALYMAKHSIYFNFHFLFSLITLDAYSYTVSTPLLLMNNTATFLDLSTCSLRLIELLCIILLSFWRLKIQHILAIMYSHIQFEYYFIMQSLLSNILEDEYTNIFVTC